MPALRTIAIQVIGILAASSAPIADLDPQLKELLEKLLAIGGGLLDGPWINNVVPDVVFSSNLEQLYLVDLVVSH